MVSLVPSPPSNIKDTYMFILNCKRTEKRERKMIEKGEEKNTEENGQRKRRKLRESLRSPDFEYPIFPTQYKQSRIIETA